MEQQPRLSEMFKHKDLLKASMADNKTTSDQAADRAREIKFKEINSLVQEYFGTDPGTLSAIYGNIGVETGDSYDYLQKQYQGGPGRGLFQFDWHRPYYAKFLKKYKKKDSPRSQIEYVHKAIYDIGSQEEKDLGIGNARHIREAFASGDPKRANDMFIERFLKPKKEKAHRDRRLNTTMKYFETIVPIMEKAKQQKQNDTRK